MNLLRRCNYFKVKFISLTLIIFLIFYTFQPFVLLNQNNILNIIPLQKCELSTSVSHKPLWIRKTREGNTPDLYDLAISDDGHYIATGIFNTDDWYGQMFLFNDSGRLIYKTSWLQFSNLAISADGEYIIENHDGTIRLYGKNSSTPLRAYNPGIDNSLSMSADGYYFVVAGWDSEIHLYNISSTTEMWNDTLSGGGVSVNVTAKISADGEFIVVGASDKLFLFNKSSDSPMWSYNGNTPLVDISADGKYIVAYVNNNITLFQNPYSTPNWTTNIALDSLAISANGEYIVGGGPTKVYLFHRNSSIPLWNYTITSSGIPSVAISYDGQYFIAGCYSSTNLYMFNRTSSIPLWGYDIVGQIWKVDISADGQYIVAGGNDGYIYFFHITEEPAPPKPELLTLIVLFGVILSENFIDFIFSPLGLGIIGIGMVIVVTIVGIVKKRSLSSPYYPE